LPSEPKLGVAIGLLLIFDFLENAFLFGGLGCVDILPLLIIIVVLEAL
jgi:hypothetical protein